MTLSPTYLKDKVDYIEHESAQHGGKKLFALGEIERSQHDLVRLDNICFFEKENVLFNKMLHGSIFDKIVAHLQIRQLEYQLFKDKNIIEKAQRYIEKMYGVTEQELVEIQNTGYRFTSDW